MMKKRGWHGIMRRCMAGALSLLMALSGGTATVYGSSAGNGTGTEMAVITPEEYEGAIKNPLMGLAEKDFFVNTVSDDCKYDQTLDYNPWSSLMMTYIPWDALENDADDTVEKIKEYCDQRWRGKGKDGKWHSYEEYNIKVIPRVYLKFPSDFGTFHGLGGDRWPADLTVNDMTSTQFNARLKRLVERLGDLWDHDPRVAYIQMGIFGTWGEQHGTGVPDNIAKYFKENFKNKQVQVRYYTGSNSTMWEGYDFGQYNDSIGDLNTDPDRWPQYAIGGEPAYDYGSGVANIHGTCPHVTAIDREYTYNAANMIRKTHSVYLTWLGDNAYGTRWSDAGDPHGEGLAYYYQNKAVIDEASEIYQKELGYRYVISRFSYTKNVQPGGKLDVSFDVKNNGSAPMYYNWPVQVSLKDPDTGKVVWADQFKDIDIRDWQSGSGYTDFDKKSGKWSKNVLAYTTEPESHTVTGSFNLPDGQSLEANKDYIIQLAVLDPEGGNIPSLRFAIKNYARGGYHPMGYVGVGKEPAQTDINPSAFDDLKVDTSLRYYRSGETVPEEKTYLQTVELSADTPIPSIVSGTEGYNLANIAVWGINSDGAKHNLAAAAKTWAVESGGEYAEITDGWLKAKKDVKTGQGTLTVTVNGVKSAPVSFAVTDDASEINGNVTDFSSGKPLQGVRVVLSRGDVIVKTVTTDEDGNYQLPPVLSGEYTLTASRDNYRSDSFSITVTKEQPVKKDIRLRLDTAGCYKTDFSDGEEAGKWNQKGSYSVWALQDETWTCTKVDQRNSWKGALTLKDKVWDNAVYEFKIKCTDSSAAEDSWGGFMIRRASADHESSQSGYLITIRKNGKIAVNRANGTNKLEAVGEEVSSAITDSFTEYHKIRVVNAGESIKIYVDDEVTPVLDVSDSKYPYGMAAFGASAAGWTFDDFSVRPTVNKEELKEQIAVAEAVIQAGAGKYTGESIQALRTAVEKAKAAADSDDVSEEALWQAYEALQVAEAGLVDVYQVTVSVEGKGMALDGETVVTSLQVTEAERRVLRIRPEEGHHIRNIQVNGEEQTVSDIKGCDCVLESLTGDTVIRLVFEKDADIAKLGEVLAQAGQYVEEEYTAGSWGRLQTAMVAAEAVRTVTAGQEAVDTACAVLEDAMKSLVSVKELRELWTEAEKIQQGNYTAESWAEFNARRENAKTVLANGAATQQEVNQALAGLKAARGGLKETQNPGGNTGNKPGGNTGNKPGGSTGNKPGGSTGNKPGGNTGNMPVEKPDASRKVTKVTISASLPYKKVAAGKKIQFTAKVMPATASNKAVAWSVSNKKYAAVNTKGKVTVKKAGIGKTVTVTATAKDGSGKKAVYKFKIVKDAVKKITLLAKKTVNTGKKITVKATVKTTGKKANKKLEWTSSNKKYAAVNAKGVVTAKKAGKNKKVKITARATDGSGKKAVITIKIR